MNDDQGGRRRGAYPGMRLVVLVTMIAGVLAVAAAAFAFSYPGLRDIAGEAGVPRDLARYYPALPDAALVVACAATYALRGAPWWTRCLGWLSVLALTAIAGAAVALHAMAVKLPRRATAATVAVAPWALLLLGFRLWLSALRGTRGSTPAGWPTAGGPGPGGELAFDADADTGVDDSASDDYGRPAGPGDAGPAGRSPASEPPAARAPAVPTEPAADFQRMRSSPVPPRD